MKLSAGREEVDGKQASTEVEGTQTSAEVDGNEINGKEVESTLGGPRYMQAPPEATKWWSSPRRLSGETKTSQRSGGRSVNKAVRERREEWHGSSTLPWHGSKFGAMPPTSSVAWHGSSGAEWHGSSVSGAGHGMAPLG